MILCLKDCRDDGSESMKPAPKPPPIGTNRACGKTTLSPRQKQVVKLVAKGLSNANIAAELGMKKATVRWELKEIRRRAGRPLRVVRTATFAVGWSRAVQQLRHRTPTCRAKWGSLPPGGGLAPSISRDKKAGQSAGKTGSAKKIAMAQTPAKPLSQREHQVLKLAAQGALDKEIAGELGISYNTVKNHAHSIRLKLGVPNMKAAVRRCMHDPIA